MISETLSLLLVLIIGITCFILNYTFVTIVFSVINARKQEKEVVVEAYYPPLEPGGLKEIVATRMVKKQ